MERLQQQFVYSYCKDERLPSSYRAVFQLVHKYHPDGKRFVVRSQFE